MTIPIWLVGLIVIASVVVAALAKIVNAQDVGARHAWDFNLETPVFGCFTIMAGIIAGLAWLLFCVWMQ